MSTFLITGLAYPAHIQLHLSIPIYFVIFTLFEFACINIFMFFSFQFVFLFLFIIYYCLVIAISKRYYFAGRIELICSIYQ